MLELLAPAGSPECVTAAVKNGANAVYMGFGDFNARQKAKNFTDEEFEEAIRYCRINGVKSYVTLNTLMSDRELPAALNLAARASQMGADAVLVQDLGLMRAIRSALPDLPLHASTQMSVHNLDGVKKAADLGASRVVLARELSREDIAYICQNSPIEIEVFCHGALCMCYSGQCYMSSVIGRRSGNRGLCAQPCRLPYSMNSKTNSYPLSLKDMCLAEHIKELEECGVKCLKIEGRMKRPEYVAITTDIYARAIKNSSAPSTKDMEDLKSAFSRQGFTDGYFMNAKGTEMFGVREDSDKKEIPLFAEARKSYTGTVPGTVPVKIYAVVRRGQPASLGIEDDRGIKLTVSGPVPEDSLNHPLTSEDLAAQLSKTGGTPYYAESIDCEIDDGLFLPVSEINEMRRSLLLNLSDKRVDFQRRRFYEYRYSPQQDNTVTTPKLNLSVVSAKQLTTQLVTFKPNMIYVPIEELEGNMGRIEPFLESGTTKIAVKLPPVIHDDEINEIRKMLDKARSEGINDALVGNLGHLKLASAHGFVLHGDTGLNIFNSESLKTAQDMGLSSATISFELRLKQIRDMSKCIDTEIITYGRLPLMTTENCVIKTATGTCACETTPELCDRRGLTFPVFKAFGCRNVIYNTKKIYLAGRQHDFSSIGLWAERLCFTTENARECELTTARYLGLDTYEPQGCTAGLYYRGVE